MRNTENRKAWFMWGIMVVTYMFNTFHATEMGVIRETLLRELFLTENQFLHLTNAFSYAYMIMQIPAGVFLDRFGVKRTAFAGNITAAIGTALFATGNEYWLLLAGRALIGLGCSVCFISVLKLCTEWFNEKIFCTMSGLTTLVGMAGAFIAQAPFASLSAIVSWHMIFLVLSGITTITAFLILFFVCDSPNSEKRTVINKHKIITAIWGVIRNPYTWPPLAVYGCFYGTYLLMSGVYGTTMISVFYHCSAIEAAACISAAVAGCALGSILVGMLSDVFHNRKKVQIIFGILYTMTWLLLLFAMESVSIILVYPVMFLLGFCSCAYAVCWSCVKEYNDPDYAGISTSIANMGGYLGSIVVPAAASAVYIAASGTEQSIFQKVILAAIVINILGVIISFFVKETRGENLYGKRG